MLKRKAIDDLIKWKEENTHKPLLMIGAKGVGKTYLAYDFGKTFFKQIRYYNFEHDLSEFENRPINQGFCLKEYLLHLQLEIVQCTSESLYILDEIPLSEELMMFLEDVLSSGASPSIILITSYTNRFEIREQVQVLPIYPLEFDEFLRATNNEWYIELIMYHFESNRKIPEIVHSELLELHNMYLKIGGMPAAVNEYLNLSAMINIAELHKLQMGAYQAYLWRCFTESEALRMNQVYQSLSMQLKKENKKFQYRLIRKGTTQSMYKDAINTLMNLNYIIRCNRIETNHFDFSIDFKNGTWLADDATNYKLYYQDVGLLYMKLLPLNDPKEDKAVQKALLENYVAQSLIAKNIPFGFWESDSMAKIDFIISKENKLIPIELFTTDQTRSKSVSILKQHVSFEYVIKISSKNFEYTNGIKYVPPYSVFCI